MKTKHPIQAYELAYDYFKHIANLCAGSILLIVIFLNKLFLNPEWTGLIGVALIAFLLCLGCSLGAQYGIIDICDYEERISIKNEGLAGLFMIFSLASIFIGLVSLIIFAFKNLY